MGSQERKRCATMAVCDNPIEATGKDWRIHKKGDVVDAACMLGAAVVATDCTVACGTLTQAITTAATGSGQCNPGTHACLKGDGACASDVVDAACMLGAAVVATDCTVACGTLTQAITTAATG